MIDRMITCRGEPQRRSGRALMCLHLRRGQKAVSNDRNQAEKRGCRENCVRKDSVREDRGRVCAKSGEHGEKEAQTLPKSVRREKNSGHEAAVKGDSEKDLLPNLTDTSAEQADGTERFVCGAVILVNHQVGLVLSQ